MKRGSMKRSSKGLYIVKNNGTIHLTSPRHSNKKELKVNPSTGFYKTEEEFVTEAIINVFGI